MRFFIFCGLVCATIMTGLVAPVIVDAYGPCREMAVWDPQPWTWRKCPRGARAVVIPGEMIRCECVDRRL